MSPRAKTGPRPQRHELNKAITAGLTEILDAIEGVLPAEVAPFVYAARADAIEAARDATLSLLAAVGVDTGSVLVTSPETPKVVRKRRG